MTVVLRRGFTLIEMLVVTVILGILVAIALPKVAATKNKAKLASVKSDLRNIIAAQEAYYSTYATYTTALPAKLFKPSAGNTVAHARSASSFTSTVTNSSITTNPKKCVVTVGTTAKNSGLMVCS
ncbi:MAG: prepilin-type N-terminal cleavage/methylation domain-containing protein [Gemmatimonadota bacterium]